MLHIWLLLMLALNRRESQPTCPYPPPFHLLLHHTFPLTFHITIMWVQKFKQF
jgi:hypothetical protein